MKEGRERLTDVTPWIVILSLLLLVLVFYALGKRLNVFTVDFILQAAGLRTDSQGKYIYASLKGTIIVFIVRVLVGSMWALAKLRFPIESLLMNSFRGKSGYVARAAYWKARLGYLGTNVIIDTGVHFIKPTFIFIGDCSWIDKNAILIAGKPNLQGAKIIQRPNSNYLYGPGELRIGRYCHIAPNALIQALGGVSLGDCASVASGGKIYSVSNHIRNPKDPADTTVYMWSPRVLLKQQLLMVGAVVLEDNSGLGLNAVVMPGVTVHENSLVGVNSLALHDVPPNTIAVGVPAT